MRWLSWFAAAALVIATSSAQASQCATCSDSGVIECKACAKTSCKSACELVRCSFALACSACRGARVADCEKCETAPELTPAARVAELDAWRASLQPIDELIGHPLSHCESQHFVLTWDIKRIDTPKTANAHEAMHVYLDRLEELFTRFVADLACTPEDFSSKTHVMLWSRAVDQGKASSKYTLQQSTTESKLMGAKPVVSIFYDKSHLHDEFELHQAVVHQVAHCLLSNVYDGIWPGNINGGWIDEGLAHFYENALFGEVRHYCYVESDSIAYFKFGRWESAVRMAVDKGEALGFLGVTGVNTVAMTPEQRMFAWSFCDYIVRAMPGKLGRVAKHVKQKKSTTDVFQSVLGLSPFQFEAGWKEWVVATYSLKKK